MVTPAASTGEPAGQRRLAYAALAAADPVLDKLVAAHGMPDPFDFHDGGRTAGSNFAAMTLHILGQQISTKVAFVLYDRLSAQTSGTPTPQAVLALGADRIRALGASRAKAAYLLNLAGHVGSGALDIEHMDDLSDQQATDALTQVKGIGAWSAQMFLIHQLRRSDVLPAADIGIRSAARTLWSLGDMPSAKAVTLLAQPWAPYRSYAAALLWSSLIPRAGGL
jgi:DNA-3-methyladenine glycosylase II